LGHVLKEPWLVRDGKLWRPTGEGQLAVLMVREILDHHHRRLGHSQGVGSGD